MIPSAHASVPGTPWDDGDAGLVEALRLDEPGATEELVERHAASVYRVASRILGANEDAAKATQDALLLVAREIHAFRGDVTFGSWVSRIAARVAWDTLRTRRRRSDEITLDEVLPLIDADDHFVPMQDWSRHAGGSAQERELRKLVSRAIDALPDGYRVVFTLHDVEGMSSPDIANVLQLGVPAVESRLHRSRLFVRKWLSDRLDPEEAA